jgi:hypothetical protein
MASRYDNLNLAIEATVNNSKKNKPYRIVETGTNTGDRAASLIALAKKLGRTNIEYYGFDFFEDTTDQIQHSEFCFGTPSKSRDFARSKIIAAGAVKVQLAKGDSKNTLPQAAADIQLAAVISIDGGGSVATIASDFANCLRFSYEGTKIVINNCIPNDFSRGSAFILKSADVLRSDYNIIVEAASPIDVINKDSHYNGPVLVQCLLVSCAAQLTPAKLEGLASILVAAAEMPVEPEPQEIMPDLTFLDPVPESIPMVNTVEPEEVSAPAAAPFPEAEPASELGAPCGSTAKNCGDNTDVQPVRVCQNSCGKLPEEHCELPSDSCGRREPGVDTFYVDNVPSPQADNPPVPEERQEPNPVVEQGSTASASEQVPGNSDGELRPEVSPDVEQGNRRGNRRRRRSGGANDERTGPQS